MVRDGEILPAVMAERSPARAPARLEQLGQLAQHAEAMGNAIKLAEAMCASDLVPAIYRNKAENGAAAILYGAELGLTPIQSLQQIFVVQGNPAIYARTMVALVKSKGHRVWTGESTDTSVTVYGQMRGDDHIEESTWTIDRAKQAGYTGNKKYQTDPQAMLYAKAASEVCRKMTPETLLGIAYSREELELESKPIKATAERIGGGTAGLRAKMGVSPSPAPAETPDDALPVTPPGKLKALTGLLKDSCLTDPAAGLAWAADVLGHPITSTKNLTGEDADKLIAELDRAAAGGAK
jgi:hypothetical protein